MTGYQIFRGTALGNEKLIGTVAASTFSFFDTGTAGTSGVPLLLSPLANNGGPVPTMAPTVPGSVFTSNKANPAVAPHPRRGGVSTEPDPSGHRRVRIAQRDAEHRFAQSLVAWLELIRV